MILPTQPIVIAAALLRPGVDRQAVDPFRTESCTVAIRNALDNAEPLDAALIFGGDGTVHRFLPQLLEQKIPFLVVPSGSGNDFAKSLGIANRDAALSSWKAFCSTRKNVREIDAGVVQCDHAETPFCCVAGMGLDSVANERANRMPRWLRGSAGYFLAALQSLPSFQAVELRVGAGEKEIRRAGYLLAVANAHRYGRGMKIAPRAVVDDGLFDVCLVGEMSKLKLLACVPTVFFGAHLRLRQVEYFQADEVRISSDRPLEVYADGEPAGWTPVNIHLLPRALRVIIPA